MRTLISWHCLERTRQWQWWGIFWCNRGWFRWGIRTDMNKRMDSSLRSKRQTNRCCRTFGPCEQCRSVKEFMKLRRSAKFLVQCTSWIHAPLERHFIFYWSW